MVVIIGILAAKHVNLIVDHLRRVAVPARRNVALLLTLEPLEHFEVASPSLEVEHVADIAILVIFDLALSLIYFLVQAHQNERIAEARLLISEASMD